VYTSIACVYDDQVETDVVITEVTFDDIDSEAMARYWQTGEPLDKAGSYAIQGLGAVFVRRISGSYTGVVGLPVFETSRLLASFGVEAL
ncbi:MAG: Maf family protein, partial [Gammaproteobacteria bacterium]|nr:Maf family protein [Gammaproteobacteria bacterium]